MWFLRMLFQFCSFLFFPIFRSQFIKLCWNWKLIQANVQHSYTRLTEIVSTTLLHTIESIECDMLHKVGSSIKVWIFYWILLFFIEIECFPSSIQRYCKSMMEHNEEDKSKTGCHVYWLWIWNFRMIFLYRWAQPPHSFAWRWALNVFDLMQWSSCKANHTIRHTSEMGTNVKRRQLHTIHIQANQR